MMVDNLIYGLYINLRLFILLPSHIGYWNVGVSESICIHLLGRVQYLVYENDCYI